MTTITINEKVNIKWNFNTFFDLYKYINENINIEIEELESQDSILKSENYKKYDKIFSKLKF